MENLKIINEETSKLLRISDDLMRLSNAFRVTGNKEMADEFLFTANDIYNAQKRISEAVGNMITEDVKRAENASIALLQVALHNSMINRDDSKIDFEKGNTNG